MKRVARNDDPSSRLYSEFVQPPRLFCLVSLSQCRLWTLRTHCALSKAQKKMQDGQTEAMKRLQADTSQAPRDTKSECTLKAKWHEKKEEKTSVWRGAGV